MYNSNKINVIQSQNLERNSSPFMYSQNKILTHNLSNLALNK